MAKELARWLVIGPALVVIVLACAVVSLVAPRRWFAAAPVARPGVLGRTHLSTRGHPVG